MNEITDFSPRTYYRSRIKLFLLLLGTLVFTALGVGLILFNDAWIVGVLTVLFFGAAGVPSITYQLIKLPYMVVNEEGVTEHALTSWGVRWQDVQSFAVVQIRRGKIVGVTFTQAARDKNAGLSQDLARGLSGYDAVVASNYAGLNAKKLAELLEAYRTHYTSQSETKGV